MDEIQKIPNEFMDGYIINIQFVPFNKKQTAGRKDLQTGIIGSDRMRN